MQDVSRQLEIALASRAVLPAEGVEIYAHDYEPDELLGFNPADAIKRYANIKLTWNGFVYERELASRGDAKRFVDSRFNGVSLRFSNVDGEYASFLANTDVDGMWCVIRRVCRDVANDSSIIFVGRLEEPGDLNRATGTLEAKQPLASIDYEVPNRNYTVDDPKGRAASDPLFEGFRFTPISGVNKYYKTEKKKVFFIFLKKKKVEHTQPWSSTTNTPIGKTIPQVVAGRTQGESIDLHAADVGETLRFLKGFVGGPLSAITAIQQRSFEGRTLSNLTVHLGDEGGTGTNATPDPQFPNAGLYSNYAYVGGEMHGSTIEQEDESPLVTAVLCAKMPVPDAFGNYTLEGFSDNPVDAVRNYLLSNRWLNQPSWMIDSVEAARTRKLCLEFLIDNSQRDRVVLPSAVQPDFDAGRVRRFRSTGFFGNARILEMLAQEIHEAELAAATAEADPEYFDQANPQISQSTVLRHRYTTNLILTDKKKAVDVLFSTLLPSFRGYILLGANGRWKIRTEEPADSSLLRADSLPGATEIALEDVEVWRESKKGFALVGCHLPSSEVRKVTATRYSDVGNSITISATTVGAITAATSGATFSGGTDTVAPSAIITISGDGSVGGTITAIIDGVSVAHTLEADSTPATAAAMLHAIINAHPTLKRYIRAMWNKTEPTTIRLYSKLGFITMERALENPHFVEEETIRVMKSFADRASSQANTTRANIRDNSFNFKYRLKDKRVNQVKGTCINAADDFAEQPLERNDEAHQERKRIVVSSEIDLTAVDNVHQAERLLTTAYGKAIEAAKGATWGGWYDDQLLEEGDVVCITEASFGLVNFPARLEEISIPEKTGPNFVARQYATWLYKDEVAPKEIPLPTVFARRAPSTPRSLTTTLGDSFAVLSWLRPIFSAEALTYEVIIGASRDATSGVIGNLLAEYNPKIVEGTVLTVPLPASGGTLYIEVRARNSQGLSAGAQTSFTFAAGSGVNLGVPSFSQTPSAPVVSIVPGSAQWRVQSQVPDTNATGVLDLQIEVRALTDNAIKQVLTIANAASRNDIAQQAEDCLIYVRYRNNWRGTTESPSDGWSVWSPDSTTAYGTGSTSTNPPDGEYDPTNPYDPDPYDRWHRYPQQPQP